MSIVMGLDRHRAQITAEWVDTTTGEIGRSRVRPADRAGVRRFLGRFRGQPLEVALEATTGWRFVVQELRAIGAEVDLAEPAETAARRGRKKRPKTDRADARHLRELLMVDRLPESWIPPEHILDLRARVRLRHTLVDQRGEWQQRIHAVLYHHGCPHHHGIVLLTANGREWLEGLGLPQAAREQVTVALRMIDMLDVQLAPIDKELRAYARRQPGCRALIGHYGIGHPNRGHDPRRARRRTTVLLLARSGPLLRPGHHRQTVRPASRARPSLPPGTAGVALGAL
jgi:transposase